MPIVVALLCIAGRVLAHEQLIPPSPVAVVDGAWPEGPTPTHDVVVQLLVAVSETGEVSEAAVDVSLSEALDAAAVEAALRWRFEPARRDGVPVASRARIAVRFRAPPPGATPRPSHAAEAVPVIAPEEAKPAPPAEAPPHDYEATARIAVPPRSASEVTRDVAVLTAAPHRTGNDLLLALPGLFVTQHGGEGKAAQIFYRGFDADHGQDLEVWFGGAPVNDVSNIHGQGYADLHFVMPEVVRTLRMTPGTYDPRQGDFAVAGTVRFDLGYGEPGLTAKASYGSFGTQRYFLAFRPRDSDERTFAAAEFYTTDGFGPSRAAQRASAIAQGAWQLAEATELRLMLSAYAGHFDSAGVLRLADIESGAVSRFATYDPQQGGASTRAQLVAEITRRTSGSRFAIAPFLLLRSLRLRQNFTGYLIDRDGDSQQQLHEDLTVGGSAAYSVRTPLFCADDRLEVGVFARTDWIDQSQKRLALSDQRVTATEVDARVRAVNVAAYLDLSLHPVERVTLRGGVRLDGLSYFTRDDGAAAAGQARASQGLHVGPKVSLEVGLYSGLSLIASYGEGFRSPQARSLPESATTPFTKVRSVEGGLRYADETLSASAAGFWTTLSDDLVFDQAKARNETVPGTQRAGASLDASWSPLYWMHFTANATYSRASFRSSGPRYRKGDLVPYAPQFVSRADLSFTPTLGHLFQRRLESQFGLGISSLARRPLPYAQLGHDIFLIDALLSVRLRELGLSLRAFNLLGSKWYDGEFSYASNWSPTSSGASLVPLRHVTVGAPRTILATLEIYL